MPLSIQPKMILPGFKRTYRLRKWLVFLIIFSLAPSAVQSGTATILTLDQAMSLVVGSHPSLSAIQDGNKVHDAAIEQARNYPNPEVEFETTNLGQGETGVVVNQLIELGGKRSARLDLVTSGRELYSIDQEMVRLNLVEEVTNRYLDVLYTQSQRELLADTRELTENIRQTVLKRIEAGAMAAVEEKRVLLDLARIDIERHQVEMVLTFQKQALSLLWGGSERDFQAVAPISDDEIHLPELDDLLSCLARNPVMKGQVELVRRRSLELALEQAIKTPDITLGAGFERSNEEDDNAIVFRLALSLPIFDRNAGNIARSRAELQREQKNGQTIELALRTQVIEQYMALLSLQERAKQLETKVLPAARAMLAEIEDLFNRGKMDLLDLFDTRRTMIELQSSLLETRHSYLKMKAALEKLVGVPLDNISICGGTGNGI